MDIAESLKIKGDARFELSLTHRDNVCPHTRTEFSVSGEKKKAFSLNMRFPLKEKHARIFRG